MLSLPCLHLRCHVSKMSHFCVTCHEWHHCVFWTVNFIFSFGQFNEFNSYYLYVQCTIYKYVDFRSWITVETKDMNKENDFVYLVTVVRSTLSMMFGWLHFCKKSHRIKNIPFCTGRKGPFKCQSKIFYFHFLRLCWGVWQKESLIIANWHLVAYSALVDTDTFLCMVDSQFFLLKLSCCIVNVTY